MWEGFPCTPLLQEEPIFTGKLDCKTLINLSGLFGLRTRKQTLSPRHHTSAHLRQGPLLTRPLLLPILPSRLGRWDWCLGTCTGVSLRTQPPPASWQIIVYKLLYTNYSLFLQQKHDPKTWMKLTFWGWCVLRQIHRELPNLPPSLKILSLLVSDNIIQKPGESPLPLPFAPLALYAVHQEVLSALPSPVSHPLPSSPCLQRLPADHHPAS